MALRHFSRASGLCKDDPSLTTERDEAENYTRQIEQYRAFRDSAYNALSGAAELSLVNERADLHIKQCHDALSIYRVLEDSAWLASVKAAPLTEEQVGEVRILATELILGVAMRQLSKANTHEAARPAAREALPLLDKAEAIHGGATAGILVLKEYCHGHSGEHTLAAKARAEASRLTTTSAQDHYFLGLAIAFRRDKQEIDRGIGHFEECIRLTAGKPHFGAHLGLAQCYITKKDYAARIAPLSTCIAIRPNDGMLRFLRGVAFRAAASYDPADSNLRFAREDFAIAAKLMPDHGQVHLEQGIIAFLQKRWNDADKHLARASLLYDDKTMVLRYRAVVDAELGRYDEALKAADEIVAARKQPPFLFYAAWAYARSALRAPDDNARARCKERSIELLEKAISAGFDQPERLHSTQAFDVVRDDPRFVALQKRARTPKR